MAHEEIVMDNTQWKIEPASAELTERVKKLEIQVQWLRQQVLDIEGKKSYTEQAREYADMRSTEDG